MLKTNYTYEVPLCTENHTHRTPGQNMPP